MNGLTATNITALHWPVPNEQNFTEIRQYGLISVAWLKILRFAGNRGSLNHCFHHCGVQRFQMCWCGIKELLVILPIVVTHLLI